MKTVENTSAIAASNGVWQGWALLLACLIATALAAYYTKSDADRDAKREFDFVRKEIQIKIQDRLSAHEQILRDGSAFFDHPAGVTREDWHRFAERQKVDQHLPGIQGIGFALLIPPQNLAQHVQEIRAQGFPEYQVRPEGERESYSSIIYLEPFTNRNLRAFGYDMFSEPVRRAAMERARDQDAAALSGKVILVQETDQDVQAGTLMYVPVYRLGMPHDTVAQRRDALVGWVYSPYRMNDLMQGILSGWDLTGEKRIHLEIFDSETVSPDTLLYDSQPNGAQPNGHASRLTLQSKVVSSGRLWTLRFTQAGRLSSMTDYGNVWLVLFGGTSISLLISGLFFVLNARFKALQKAGELSTELAQSEQSYRNQFVGNSAVMLMGDPKDGAILDANAAAVSFYGYSRERLLTMRINDINTKPIAEVLEVLTAIKPEKGQRLQFQHRLANGELRDVELSISRIQFGGRPVFHAIVFDITERMQAEDALRRSEAKLKSALASMTDAVFISDAQGRFIDFNDAFATFHRFEDKDQCAKHLAEYPDILDVFMPNGELAPLEQWAVPRALRGEIVTNAEYILRRKDTGETWVGSYSFAPIRDNDGNIVGSVVTGRDITERKRLEAAQKNLEIQNRQLQKAESLSRMAGAIAHHFNNQLQAVMMGLQMAMSDLPQTAIALETLTDAMLSARKAAKVSSLMLTYIGQTAAKHEPLYLCEACQRQLSIIRADLPKDMVLETDFLTPGPVINANANQIQQVLTNLVTNAWEALGDTRSAIRVAVKTVCVAEIPAANCFPIDYKPQDTDYACLEVRDAGCGIAAEDMEKLFDPFFSSKFTGRGLGLPVVLGIVRAHKGCVTVESQPKRGSVFRIFLPLSAEAVLPKPAPPVQAPQTGGGGTVLLVDDEPIVRKSIESVLKRSGFTVLTAVDGVDAVEVFQRHRDEIGCVLCDLMMPRMNGWETLTALRKLSPGFPVLLSSGYSEAQVMAGDHPELPQAFLSKPYQFETLINTIARFMRNTDQTVKNIIR